MNPVERADIHRRHLPPLEPVDEERRIRRGMRLNVKDWSKKTTRALPPAIIGGAALLAGGFCLGWGAFKIWHE
jgi:hypothetical protein